MVEAVVVPVVVPATLVVEATEAKVGLVDAAVAAAMVQ